MRPATYDEIRERISARSGVPAYWASVFFKASLSLRAVEAYLETADSDITSPLRIGKSEFLASELAELNKLYGIEEPEEDRRGDEIVRYLVSVEEQEAILHEVSAYARVRFKPAVKSTYCAHAVARSVRMINARYLSRMVPKGQIVCEMGADLRTLPYRSVDLKKFRVAAPRLGIRDVIRTDYINSCRKILRQKELEDHVRRRAIELAEHPDEYIQWVKIQHCTWKCDVLLSNDASHDIAFGDIPRIMAARGAHTWYGAMMRVKGLTRFTPSGSGDIPMLNARYTIDRKKNTISFHFRHDASFNYVHTLSEHERYEEHCDYVFRGKKFDYIYTRLPSTTDSTLFFSVYRVPAYGSPMKESSFAHSGHAGKVLVKSVKTLIDSSGVPCCYEPFNFEMDETIYERVAEHRHSLGKSGNLAATISYLKTLRVRFYINGECIGVEGRMSQELLESAAVAIEVTVAENRRSAEVTLGMMEQRRKNAINKVTHSESRFQVLMSAVMMQAANHRYAVGAFSVLMGVWSNVRSGLINAAMGASKDLIIEVIRQSPYIRIDGGAEVHGEDVSIEGENSYPCRDLQEVNTALSVSTLSKDEREHLEEYRAYLSTLSCEHCTSVDEVIARASESNETFFDAFTGEEENEEVFEEDTSYTDGFDDIVDLVTEPMNEYISVKRYQAKAIKSQVVRDASVLFRNGVPSETDLKFYAKNKITHSVIRVVEGELVEARNGKINVAAVYDVQSGTLQRVSKFKGGYYINEQISGWVYSCSELEVFNHEELASATEMVVADYKGQLDLSSCKFIMGVPGCGKTYEIKQELRKLPVGSYLYLSTTANSVKEVRKDLFGDHADGLKYVRTLDSYLMGADVPCEVLRVDEAPMSHAGQVFAAIIRSGAKNVKLYGDYEQCTYVSYVSAVLHPILHSKFLGMMPTEFRSVSHRCPQDVCDMWKHRYEKGFIPCDCAEHKEKRPEKSLKFVRISSASDIPYDENTRYMVYTQKEKIDLHQALGFEASIAVVRQGTSTGLATVHEDQGSTHKKVALVRLIGRYDPKESPLSPSIYNNNPHNLTGSTRHTESFTYYSTSMEEDNLVKHLPVSAFS